MRIFQNISIENAFTNKAKNIRGFVITYEACVHSQSSQSQRSRRGRDGQLSRYWRVVITRTRCLQGRAGVQCRVWPVPGSLTLEGSDVGDRGVCWAGWAGLGWAGLLGRSGRRGFLGRKWPAIAAAWRTATLACVGTGGNFVTIFFDVNLNTS